MKILLIGSGGREHALAWKLEQSPKVEHLFALPGNPGVEQVAECFDIPVDNFDKVEFLARDIKPDLIVIGPEDPLALGLTDRLQKAGLRVFGPSKEAAQLEADKWFAKEMMRHQNVPTAEARSFTNADAATTYVQNRPTPIVVKAAGLAKGKGVTLCYREADAVDAIDKIMRKKIFGEAGARVVIEEFMRGPEVSVMAFVDRRNIYLMESAQDHKPVDDGDTGPMTGGMGAYSPAPVLTGDVLATIERQVFVPILDGLMRDGIPYRGVLYAGMMLTPAGPRVLEFNCRFGDPETQPLMMRLKTDLVDVLNAVVDGKLDQISIEYDRRPAMSVVLCSKGYPGKTRTGDVITGVDAADAMKDVKVFHGGTAYDDQNRLVTAGGRVLAVTAIGETLAAAQQKCYAAAEKIKFDGMHYRRDIGRRALR